jgi:hypothetical protein
MFGFIRLVSLIAVSIFLGVAFGAAVGDRSWLGPCPFAIAFGAVGGIARGCDVRSQTPNG